MDNLLIDIKIEIISGAVEEAPKAICITFIFSKNNSQVKFWLKTRITAKEFIFELVEFVNSAFSKLIMNLDK